MLINLLTGLSTMVVCLLLQLFLLIATLRYYQRNQELVHDPSFWHSIAVLSGVMLLLVIGNAAQIAIWAAVFLLLDEFQQFGGAFYHSAVNFATLGYGDFVMSEQHKLLGPLEALNGVLMIGVSTAALMSAFQDTVRKTVEARHL
jgi:hypothetical protein